MTARTRSASKAGLSVLAGLLAVLLSSQATMAAVTWTSPVNAGPSYSWNYGQALARTQTPNTTYLHTQYTTDLVGGEFVSDTGPYLGVYYRRSNSTANPWTSTKRMNGADEHGANGALAAAGQYVYVAWTSLQNVVDYDPLANREIRIRVNDNYGANDAWGEVRSGFLIDRIDRSAVAAAGNWFYLVYTDAGSGNISLFTNQGGGGETLDFAGPTTVGTTSYLPDADEGYAGLPVVAAVGDTIMVAWITGPSGGITARTSTDNGQNWADPVVISTAPAWDLQASGDGSRIVLSYANATSIKTKVLRDGTWLPTRTAATFSSSGTYKIGYGPAAAVAGNSRLGVAWSACTRSDCSAGSTKGVNLLWRESTDNGATWKSTVTLSSYTSSSSKRYNDYPSVVMTSTPRRYVMYNTATSTFSSYRTIVEVGHGTP